MHVLTNNAIVLVYEQEMWCRPRLEQQYGET